ncbi:MAG: hypothetical protein H6630_09415 [Arcobacter sp.]|nr:hypothetical protein [Arcobacter sp.]
MKKNEDAFVLLVATVGFVFILYWLYIEERKKNLLLLQENNDSVKIPINYNITIKNEITILNQYKSEINKLKENIQNNKVLSIELKSTIINIIENNKDISVEIINELFSISMLVENGKFSKALLFVAKIFENQLKAVFSNNTNFIKYTKTSKKSSNIVFNDYIEFCKKDNILTSDEYYNAKALKELRNKEAHELSSISMNEEKGCSMIFIGLELILKLSKLNSKEETKFD